MAAISGDFSMKAVLDPNHSTDYVRQEVSELARLYHARRIKADMAEVRACMENPPNVLHFAVHGASRREGGRDGLMLADDKVLDPFIVRGFTLTGRPFVFLNACQSGMGYELLGDYAGTAASFVYIGAAGVVAPLWNVESQAAKSVALGFYRMTLEGLTAAEALHRLRGGDEGHEPAEALTALAYRFYGHPCHRLSWQTELRTPSSLI
jgi:CHAT domain-containing protein